MAWSLVGCACAWGTSVSVPDSMYLQYGYLCVYVVYSSTSNIHVRTYIHMHSTYSILLSPAVHVPSPC